MKQVFSLFRELLAERLQMGVRTTEDSVSYTFFHALLSSGFCSHVDVVMEQPHPTIPGAEIDTVIRQGNESQSVALEFKYHSKIPSGKNQPVTENAGKCFGDQTRLANLPPSLGRSGYFVYLTDEEMSSYYRRPTNGLYDWFELPEMHRYPITCDFIAQRKASFRKHVKDNRLDFAVVCILSQELPMSHSLRIYLVESKSISI